MWWKKNYEVIFFELVLIIERLSRVILIGIILGKVGSLLEEIIIVFLWVVVVGRIYWFLDY